MVIYGKYSAAAAEVRLAAKIAYHGCGPSGENLRELLNELDFGLRFLVKKSGVDDTAKVLDEALRDGVHVFLLEPLAHLNMTWTSGELTGLDIMMERPEVVFLRTQADPRSSIIYSPGRPRPLVRAGSVHHRQLSTRNLELYFAAC